MRKRTNEEIEARLEYMRAHGEKMLRESGEIAGILDASQPGEKVGIIIPFMFSNPAEKQILYSVIKQVLKAHNATEFFLLTEAWAAMGKNKEDGSNDLARWRETHDDSLEKFPGRREVMMVQYIAYDDVRMRIYEMHRDADGKFSHLDAPEVFDSKPNDSTYTAAGALLELLPQPGEFRAARIH
jgi:hypothetical protein